MLAGLGDTFDPEMTQCGGWDGMGLGDVDGMDEADGSR